MNVQGRVHILRVVAKGDGLEQGRRNWGGAGGRGSCPSCLLLGGARGAEVPFEL
jgi:hypothetical protein